MDRNRDAGRNRQLSRGPDVQSSLWAGPRPDGCVRSVRVRASSAVSGGKECVNQGRSSAEAGWTGEGLLEVVNPGVTGEVTA